MTDPNSPQPESAEPRDDLTTAPPVPPAPPTVASSNGANDGDLDDSDSDYEDVRMRGTVLPELQNDSYSHSSMMTTQKSAKRRRPRE